MSRDDSRSADSAADRDRRSDSSGSMSVHKEEYDGSRLSSSSAKREHDSPPGKSELDRLAPSQKREHESPPELYRFAPLEKNFYVESKSMSESEVEEHRRWRREITGSQCPEISLKQKASSSQGQRDEIDIGLRGQRTQGREDEEQVRFVLAVSAFFAIRWMNFNANANGENDDNVNGDEINGDDDENNNANANGDENNEDDVDDRVVQNAGVRQRDIENGNEPTFDLCDMSTFKIFHYIQLVLYAIVLVLMAFSLTKYVDLGIFNGNGYNFFLLIIGAIGSLLGTVLPTYVRKKCHRRLYSHSWKGFASRVVLLVLDGVLFVVTTVGAVRLVRCLKGRASLLPLGLNLAATILLRITQLNDADHGYTDMLIALFVGKVDEEYKHLRRRDLLVNISAIGWISFRIIGMMVMRESKGEKNIKINTIIRELKENLLILQGRLTNSEENRQIIRLMSKSLDILKRILRED